MGEHDVLDSLDEDRRRRFSRAVLDDLRALDQMCAAGLIERGVRRIGAEQEMFLVDRSGRPAPVALDASDLAGTDILNSAAVYLGGETPLGPAYLGFGYSTSGASNFFLSIGIQ